jgi:antirestriction protein ArdC
VNTKTKEELIKMYLESLEENKIPWRQRWNSSLNKNGITNTTYKGINQLLLSYVSYKEHYEDNRWFTYVQIKDKGYKLKNSKGKGVPIEFWSVYDTKSKKKISFEEYNKIINSNPELKEQYKTFCNVTYVFNGSLVEGIKEIDKNQNNNIQVNSYINKIINKLKVNYKEEGDKAFYNVKDDQVVLPESNKFFDKYSYYATQLHELCHSTRHESRLNRFEIKDKQDYAREELIAEISSSFLMQKLDINPKSEDYNNHKAYIQSWIQILKDKPNELFKAINEANKVCNYIEEKIKVKEKETVR